jgi:Ni/Fe-hydrogenase 1 B-type cytochrome subunit
MAYDRVYRHGLGARIVHLLHLVAMILVILSGFQILYPLGFKIFGTLGTARKIHFYGMYLIIFPLIFRFFYHMWVTGDVRNFFIGPRDIKYIPSFLKYYLFLGHDKPWSEKHEYNPGQKMTYLLWPVLLVLQAITGFAIYWFGGHEPAWLMKIWPGFVPGAVSFFGGIAMLKFWHTMIAWVFVITVAIHLYLGSTGVTLADAYQSMITGYERFERKKA